MNNYIPPPKREGPNAVQENAVMPKVENAAAEVNVVIIPLAPKFFYSRTAATDMEGTLQTDF